MEANEISPRAYDGDLHDAGSYEFHGSPDKSRDQEARELFDTMCKGVLAQGMTANDFEKNHKVRAALIVVRDIVGAEAARAIMGDYIKKQSEPA